MEKVWDLVIVGGGLGGLALAAELAAPEFKVLSILVLERRRCYERDRTWSYWTSAKHRYSHLERCSWSEWTVKLGDVVHSQFSHKNRYASLDADAFYNDATKAIGGCDHVSLRMNCCVSEMQSFPEADTLITLDQGETVRARRVMDARPAQQTASGALVQQFAGWEIQLKRDVFDADKVQLMNLEVDRRGLHFFYVLPYSPRCALVESTWISPAQWHPDYEAELTSYIARLCNNADFSVSYRESGVLGLQVDDATAAKFVGLGRRGGTLRASTGYAFLDTMVHATQLARSLAKALRAGTLDAWQPAAFQRDTTETWMDAVFLDVLKSDWERAPNYFMQLFDAIPVDDTVAFLTGRANWHQRLRVMRSLPLRPFARAAMQSSALGRWLGEKSQLRPHSDPG